MNTSAIVNKMKDRKRLSMVLFIVFTFEVLTHMFTAFHNIPFLSRGINAEFAFVSPFIGATGELWALVSLMLALVLSGAQRKILLVSHVIMFISLLINAAIDNVTNLDPVLSQNFYLHLYAVLIAPVIIFLIIGVSLILLVANDPYIEQIEAERELQHLQHQTTMVGYAMLGEAMRDEIQKDSHSKTVSDGAMALVKNLVASVSTGGRHAITLASQPQQPAPTLTEVEPKNQNARPS